MGNKIAIKVISPEHGAKVIKYLESLGGVNHTSYEVIAENIQLLGKAEKSESNASRNPDKDDLPF